MAEHDDLKIGSIRHIVEHAERPLHPFLAYCEYMLGLMEKAQELIWQAQREQARLELDVEAARDLVDAARVVCDYYQRPSMARPTRQETDMIDRLYACVASIEA